MCGKICLGGQTLDVCAIWDEEAKQQVHIQEAATKAGSSMKMNDHIWINHVSSRNVMHYFVSFGTLNFILWPFQKIFECLKLTIRIIKQCPVIIEVNSSDSESARLFPDLCDHNQLQTTPGSGSSFRRPVVVFNQATEATSLLQL